MQHATYVTAVSSTLPQLLWICFILREFVREFRDFGCCNPDLDPMTFTYELKLVSVSDVAAYRKGTLYVKAFES